MKMSEFYEELAKTNKRMKWELDDFSIYSQRKELRAKFKSAPNSEKCFCPITAVCYMKTGIYYNVYDTESAAGEIGLRDRYRQRIVDAADQNYIHDDQRGSLVRKKLLNVVKLEG